MTPLLAGLTLGIAGSAHCLLMCGPLVALAGSGSMAASRTDGPPWLTIARSTALYHAGRVGIYLVLGGMAGGFGSALSAAGLGRPLTFVIGIALVLWAAASASLIALPGRAGGAWTGRALGAVAGWMQRHRVRTPLVLGMLNGLLPCGLVYAAAVAAAGWGTVGGGMLCMLGFGLGTTPALVVAGLPAPRVAPVMARARRVGPLVLA
ncbi:MAG TPA: sulfite exporter TauE/SafE family protein, partial [Vicinamibacterales bacterium]